ncbi:hypothetical protein GGQ74_001426 [Desulfobaculum xiamenense]|uniref:SPOR domain-containing protein n=1 Tax=Desulfobaculum xiamenense TaxID=995050 RepID=A0A846QG61_9BACT|nr:hypothetical protein [Desulfobaculum xiamenense]NJB67786.1 hypothetical protein [Desulfobaculum xiamenense]
MTPIPDIAALINSMTIALRRIIHDGPPEDQPEEGWWVLVCGRALNPDDFEQRELARRELREMLDAHGLTMREYIWVWDNTDTAQVVAGRHVERPAADDHARALERMGLRTRVVPRFRDV